MDLLLRRFFDCCVVPLARKCFVGTAAAHVCFHARFTYGLHVSRLSKTCKRYEKKTMCAVASPSCHPYPYPALSIHPCPAISGGDGAAAADASEGGASGEQVRWCGQASMKVCEKPCRSSHTTGSSSWGCHTRVVVDEQYGTCATCPKSTACHNRI